MIRGISGDQMLASDDTNFTIGELAELYEKRKHMLTHTVINFIHEPSYPSCVETHTQMPPKQFDNARMSIRYKSKDDLFNIVFKRYDNTQQCIRFWVHTLNLIINDKRINNGIVRVLC